MFINIFSLTAMTDFGKRPFIKVTCKLAPYIEDFIPYGKRINAVWPYFGAF